MSAAQLDWDLVLTMPKDTMIFHGQVVKMGTPPAPGRSRPPPPGLLLHQRAVGAAAAAEGSALHDGVVSDDNKVSAPAVEESNFRDGVGAVATWRSRQGDNRHRGTSSKSMARPSWASRWCLASPSPSPSPPPTRAPRSRTSPEARPGPIGAPQEKRSRR